MVAKLNNYYGIDFGTTSSAVVGYMVMDHKPEQFQYGDDEGRPIPSVVAINKTTGEVVTGREAWDRKMELSESCEYFSSIKSVLDRDTQITIAGREWKPVDIAAELFKSLRTSVQERTGNDLSAATVAIPIGFSPEKRNRLREAARKLEFAFDISPVDPKPVMRDILESNVDERYTLSDKLWAYLQNYAQKHKAAGNGFGFGMADPDGVARTLSARCFIKLNSLMKERYELVSQDIVKVQGNGLYISLVKGKGSRVKYRNPRNGEVITLSYNPKAIDVPTVTQRPDNVLTLEKKGADIHYEYVFDAKYRVNPALPGTDYYNTISHHPGPEVGDINTMHRYICTACRAVCDKPYQTCPVCGTEKTKVTYDASWVDEAAEMDILLGEDW